MERQFAIGAAQRVVLSTVSDDTMLLSGMIGVDTVLTSGGEVYVGQYDLDQ